MSYALDLTEGQPQGHAARSCLIGMRIADELRLSADDRSDLFYALLMKDAGCSSNAARVYQLFGGDDQATKRGPLAARLAAAAREARLRARIHRAGRDAPRPAAAGWRRSR